MPKPLGVTPVVEVIVIIGSLAGLIGGTWAVLAMRSAAKKPAAEVDGRRVLRAGIIWWSTAD